MDDNAGQGTENQGSQGAAGAGSQSSATGASLSDVMTGASASGTTSTAEPNGTGSVGEGAGAGQGVGAQGTPALGKWADQLPKEIRENPDAVKTLSKFTSFGDITKSYLELSGKLGSSIQIPGKDATVEQKAAFFKQLGRPESADKYGFKQEHDGAKSFAKIAHEVGLSDDQAKALYQHFENSGADAVKARQAMMQKQQVDTETALKKEYGDKYPQAIETLRRGLENFGGKELLDVLVTSGLSFHPAVVRTFIRIGEKLSEAGATSRTGGAGNAMKPLAEGGGFEIKI